MTDTIIHIERTFNNTVDEVWKALTQRDEIRKWYFDIPDMKTEVGYEFSFYSPGSKNQYLYRCRILSVIPFEKIQYTWSYPERSDIESIVTWELIPRGQATIVRLTHEGDGFFGTEESNFSRDNFEIGWSEILGNSLHNYLLK